MHRVKNEYGPQTKLDHTNALDKLMENPSPTKIKQENKSFLLNDGLNERLGNAESFLGIQPVKTIFARVKAIEDRILYLESVSPEYNHFMVCSIQMINNNANFNTVIIFLESSNA